MLIALVICFVASLLPCYASWHRLKIEYKESSLFLFGGAIFYSFLFLYGITTRLYLGNAKDEATIQQMYALAGQTGFGLQQLQTLLVFSTYALSLVNLILGYIVYKKTSYYLFFVVCYCLNWCFKYDSNTVYRNVTFCKFLCGVLWYHGIFRICSRTNIQRVLCSWKYLSTSCDMLDCCYRTSHGMLAKDA